jgi:hypothetical protein
VEREFVEGVRCGPLKRALDMNDTGMGHGPQQEEFETIVDPYEATVL